MGRGVLMETKKPPATDSELFKRMGVSFVKVENEDGSVKYEPRYSYRIKAEEAKKELLSRHQKKEHLTLRRHQGDTAKTAFWSYNIELWITGWNDSRGRYHWPYWVYIVPTLLFIGIGVLIGKNLNGFLSILIFLTFISFGWGMGWILHLAYTRHRTFDITEIAIDGMKDIIAAVPKEMDIDKRYVEIQPEIGTPLAVTHFPVPEDFMENVLIIGGIPTKSRKGKPGALIHNHVYNICIGPGIAGRKYSNANFIQGIPTVNIIPRRKESVMEAFTQMVGTSPKRSLTPEQIVEATELVDSVYPSPCLHAPQDFRHNGDCNRRNERHHCSCAQRNGHRQTIRGNPAGNWHAPCRNTFSRSRRFHGERPHHRRHSDKIEKGEAWRTDP